METSKDLVVSSSPHCSPQNASEQYAKPLVRLVKKLTKLKSQEKLMTECGELDIFSSLRPRVGKTFKRPDLNNELNRIIEETRRRITDIGIIEKAVEITETREKIDNIYNEMQKVPFPEFRKLHEKAKKAELKLQCTLTRNMERKVRVFQERQEKNTSLHIPPPILQKEKRRRHKKTKAEIRKKYEKRRRCRRQERKRLLIQDEIQKIKQSNLVKNFSSEDVPDEVYLYLALGSQFCPTVEPKKHDYIFDTKVFCRKLAWSAYHEHKKNEALLKRDGDPATDLAEIFMSDDEDDHPIYGWNIPTKLRIKCRKMPDYSDNLLSHITKKLKNAVYNLQPPDQRQKNLTILEAKGQKWCKAAIKERRLYITKVDKGGCILILNAAEVDKIMRETLNDKEKFQELKKDPRADITKKIKELVSSFEDRHLLTSEEVFAISGLTKNGGMSRGHEFVIRKTYMYPLFKLHKLTEDMILMKKIPPTRMVTSGVGGPTYRLGLFLDSLLKPIVQQYCHGEVIKDSTDFLIELQKMESDGLSRSFNFVGTLDVDALYPSIRLDLALKALEDALKIVTAFTDEQIQMTIHLAKFCIENSVVHYRGKWFRSLVGIPTGGPESGSIANVVVFFVVEKILFIDPKVSPLNKILSRKRFLDDLFFGWTGTIRQFSKFKLALNEVGTKHGITFKGDVRKTVDFLDCTVYLQPNGCLTTKMYVKPTDASRYLNRRSDHSPHTFTSIPFSQFRRAAVLCSQKDEKAKCMDYISEKLMSSDFKLDEVKNAKEKALKLKRSDVLCSRRNIKRSDKSNKTLTFVINRNGFMVKEIKGILRECQPDIDRLLGKTRIIVAERRNANIASTVFAKSSFSKEENQTKRNQKCNGKGCKTCEIMILEKEFTVWKNNDNYRKDVKLDFRCNCSTDCIIYIYVCNLCKNNESFYVGQSINSCQTRANGHRACFTEKLHKKSALSYHIYKDHPEFVKNKLLNYSLGVIKSTSGTSLDRTEDFFVEHLKADLSLNRYKVTS